MKLPSIQYLAVQAQKSIIRFPLSIISALVAAVIAIYTFEYQDEITNHLSFVNIILVAALGIPAYFCAQVLVENRQYNLLGRLLSYALPTTLLLLIYLSLPDSTQSDNISVPYIRYAVYNLIIHLLVSFVPYWQKGSLNAFWNYNKLLFLRFLTSALYSFFLYSGLALALTALDLLFEIDLHYELFMHLFIVIAFLFNTWFFVAGIPYDFQSLETDTNYPKGLKVFTQYVLLPIIALYLIILYCYGIKIIIEWHLPKGIVSYLISGVSTLGIFTFLLIYPYGNDKESTWIKKFTLGYYYLLFPLIALLFIAILMRLDAYGFTIKRYIVLLLGIWLTINAFYFIIKRKNIKFIPISLAIILGLMSFGPWGMFSLSERSQSNRLISILETNGIIKEGKIVNETFWDQDSLPLFHSTSTFQNDHLLTDSLNNEVYSIIQYLGDFHTFKQLYPYFSQDLKSMLNDGRDSNNWVNNAPIIAETMGLKYEYRPDLQILGEEEFFVIHSLKEDVKTIRGYDYLQYFNRQLSAQNQGRTNYSIDGNQLTVGIKDSLKTILYVSYLNDTLLFEIEEFRSNLMRGEMRRSYQEFPLNKMTLVEESDQMKVKLEIDRINFRVVEDSMRYNFIDGDLYLKRK